MEAEKTSIASSSAPPPPPPVSVPRYTPIAEIGRGGTATAYLAAIQGPGDFKKLVVVKQLRPSLAAEPDFLKMFLDEARLSARIDHPNVVHTTEVGFDGEHHYIAMEYLDGQSLEAVTRRLARRRRSRNPSVGAPGGEAGMPLELYLFVLSQMLRGLDFAHELKDFDGTPLNVVHRDVSPHNVMITYEGQVKVLDFGIAKAADSSGNTRTGMMKGKCAYMPAEQFDGGRDLDRRADVFAVGVILWQALAGRKLWSGLSDAEIFQHVAVGNIPPPSRANAEVPAELEAICMKALALRREDRYATAAGFQTALDEYVLSHPELRTSSKDLGRFVSELFADDRAKVKAIIEAELGGRASRKSATIPVFTQAASGPSTGAAVRESDADEGPPPSSGTRSFLPLAAVTFAAVVVAGVAVARGRAPTTMTDPSATAAGAEALVSKLTIRATPPETKVWFDDALLDENPVSSVFRRDGVKHRVRGEAPGYLPKAEWITLDVAEVTMDLVLERAPTAAPPAPKIARKEAPVSVPARTPSRGAPSQAPVAATASAPEPTSNPTPAPPPTKAPTGPELDTSDPWAPGKR